MARHSIVRAIARGLYRFRLDGFRSRMLALLLAETGGATRRCCTYMRRTCEGHAIEVASENSVVRSVHLIAVGTVEYDSEGFAEQRDVIVVDYPLMTTGTAGRYSSFFPTPTNPYRRWYLEIELRQGRWQYRRVYPCSDYIQASNPASLP